MIGLYHLSKQQPPGDRKKEKMRKARLSGHCPGKCAGPERAGRNLYGSSYVSSLYGDEHGRRDQNAGPQGPNATTQTSGHIGRSKSASVYRNPLRASRWPRSAANRARRTSDQEAVVISTAHVSAASAGLRTALLVPTTLRPLRSRSSSPRHRDRNGKAEGRVPCPRDCAD